MKLMKREGILRLAFMEIYGAMAQGHTCMTGDATRDDVFVIYRQEKIAYEI